MIENPTIFMKKGNFMYSTKLSQFVAFYDFICI